ncbi:MAG: M3 family metallopeptidase [Bacteroidales bacterium]
MKKLVLFFILTSIIMTSCKNDKNPLLADFNTPFDTPPFSAIKHEHYLPAFKAAISESKEEIEKIANNPEAPNFKNTIESLSLSGSKLSTISNIFFNLNQAETDEKMQNIAREISPLLSDHSSDVLFNDKLFKRIKSVYDNKNKFDLNIEQTSLLDKTYKNFARNGADLSEDKKARLREISKELSELSLKFNDNVLAETNSWHMHITEQEDLSGLPETIIEAAAEEAKSRDMDGWVFTLQIPSAWPFLHYADNRSLREKLYKAYNKRAYNGNEYDNTDLILQIVNLRLEKANILGYDSHADFVLVERMAENSEKVNSFLTEVATSARPKAIQDFNEVQALASEMGLKDQVHYWDWYYYAEKMKNKRFNYNEEEVRPYLQLENVKTGIFDLCGRLWGLSFKPNKEIDVYHSDVDVYEVYDNDQTLLSILYLDFFPRAGKSSGAWMTSYRKQHRINESNIIPHISVVCNFSKPTENRPSLLTYDEFTTFLHEFGHALHGMLSDVTYSDLSGTSVYRDFVELPSQVMENWAYEKEFLDNVAVHYETGEKIPEDLVQKVIDSKNFHSAFTILRQLSFGLTDMAWHSVTEPVNMHPEKFEAKAMAPTYIFPKIEGTMMSSAFTHIFAGGYAAGYYGYKWAEILDADAFEAFKENGIFDKETASLFREHVLSKGGSEHPMKLYKRFRGQEPEIEPYLRREGLIE